MNTLCSDWSRPLSDLPGIGPKVEAKLARLGLANLQDLLFHLPTHYQDRTRAYPIGQLQAGEKALIEGVIQHVQVTARRQTLICRVKDNSGWVSVCFFHYSKAQQYQLNAIGKAIRCFGEMRWGPFGREMAHPDYQLIDPDNPPALPQTLTPVYPLTDGISQYQMRRFVQAAIAQLSQDGQLELEDYLPQALKEAFHLGDLATSLQYLHEPPKTAHCQALANGLHPAQRRLAFEELMAYQLSFFKLRRVIRNAKAPAFTDQTALAHQFLSKLPFQLTNAQQRVVGEIQNDLAQTRPMLRLLQGDVGSGKTVVAALALIQVVAHGYQAAIMAPTEILAEQHFQNLKQWLETLSMETVIYTGKLKPSIKRQCLSAIAEGHAQVIIGTHALFQQDVVYHRLGLLIIDEQHRFGVQQRLALREKGLQNAQHPHQLIMTATPIPRTLAMTAYADLDVSLIDELPKGRQPITTVAMPNDRRETVIQRIRVNCQAGRQVYWVCPLIEDSEALQCQAAASTAEQLAERLPELRVGLVHGRLKPDEKDQVMKAFTAGQLDLLVATTVIEVGVDVPNASLMVIENPERLGLSQLHQLRGRIGRGTQASHCVLLYQPPLSEQGKQRLAVLRATQDGFKIAQEDMALRGAGEVLGTKQTGTVRFKVADTLRDEDLLNKAQQAARMAYAQFPDCVEPLIERWRSIQSQYGQV